MLKNERKESTPSGTPIWIAIFGLSSKYSPIVILILWNFLEQFMAPPSATTTWNSSVGYKEKMRSLANFYLMKLWVLLESINIVSFLFLIYPYNLRVWGVLMLTNEWYIYTYWDCSSLRFSSSSQYMYNNFFSLHICPLLLCLSRNIVPFLFVPPVDEESTL